MRTVTRLLGRLIRIIGVIIMIGVLFSLLLSVGARLGLIPLREFIDSHPAGFEHVLTAFLFGIQAVLAVSCLLTGLAVGIAAKEDLRATVGYGAVLAALPHCWAECHGVKLYSPSYQQSWVCLAAV